MTNDSILTIDGLQYSNWSREIFEQMRAGGVNAVHATLVYHENTRETLSRFGDWNRRFEQHADLIMPVFEPADIERAQASNRVGVFFGAQNCSPIEDDIDMVAVMRRLGLLIMQLTYNNQSLVATGCYESEDNGITRFGRQAVADAHGGMMSGSGFYASWGVNMLNLLAGSYNQKGGMAHGGGKYNGMGNGPRYDLESFPGQVGPKGVFLSRSRFPYEKTSEYQRKVAAGQNPYPAAAPWRTLAPPALTEHMLSGLYGYPYKIKAIISCMANPLYGQAGLADMAVEKLKDPAALGLFISVDGFINETNRYADYLVPDSVMYEVWGLTDAFRHFHDGDKMYSWWDYRGGDFHQGRGMRIDLLLCSASVMKRANWCVVDRNARKGKLPSDHAPVIVDID